MLTPFFPPPVQGGIPLYAQCLSDALTSEGIRVTVLVIPFTTQISSEIVRVQTDAPYAVYSFTKKAGNADSAFDKMHNYRWSKIELATLDAVDAFLKRIEPVDVVHINDYFGAMYIEYFKVHRKLPVVCTMHAMSSVDNALADSLRRYTVINSDVVFTVSDYLRGWIQRKYGASVENVHFQTTYNGVAHSNNLPFGERSNDIVFCGRFSQLKGGHILYRALGMLKAQGVSYQATMIGEGPEQARLEALADELGIASQIRYTGFLSNEAVRRIMAQSKLNVICSSDETFGITALEAMSEGACVIASNVGGLREFIVDGVNGVLYEYGDVEQLAQAMRTLLRDEEQRNAYSQAAHATANAMTWQKVARQTIAGYISAAENFDAAEVSILGKGI